MILPIVAYGHPALREETQEVKPDHPGLEQLIADMWETMYNARGVGLAAPQVGHSLRMFMVDAGPMQGVLDDEEELEGFKKLFINPKIIEEEGEEWPFEEGCLSIPDVREDVFRQPEIRIRYQDEAFEEHEETFSGMKARIIQHEYDHIEGVLFTDYVRGLRKQVIKSRLNKISKGKIEPDYPMEYAK